MLVIFVILSVAVRSRSGRIAKSKDPYSAKIYAQSRSFAARHTTDPMIQTLEWTPSGVVFIDQTKLPTEEVYVTCTTHRQVADVIRNMVVRGAPAIGVAAAMGIALGAKNSQAENGAELKKDFDQICETIRQTRPTAVNLFWAIRRMTEKFERIRIWPIA